LIADSTLSAVKDATGTSPKSRAIQNAVDYANAQIKWANTFYSTAIPAMTTPT